MTVEALDPASHYVRHPLASAVTTAGRILFARPGEATLDCSEVDPAAAAVLWEALATPVSAADLLRGPPAASPSIGPLLEALLQRGFVFPWAAGEATRPAPGSDGHPPSRPCPHLVVGITGAVQALLMPQLVQRLSSSFADRVDVILTPSARKFLRPRALAVLGAAVWCDPFHIGETGTVPHVRLAAADLVLVVPATADSLFRLAHGSCSDLLSLVVGATAAPVVVVPSMNPVMWRRPAVRRNVQLLRHDGVLVVEPGPGWSVGDRSDHRVGGIGLGPDGANLPGILEAALRLNR